MKFTAFGHPNITCTHKNTFEFTKEKNVTKNGDCIVGVKADYKLSELKKLLGFEKVLIRITVGDFIEEIVAKPNPCFSSDHELVVRRSDFTSERTFAFRADKVAADFNFKDRLSDENQRIIVELTVL